VGRGARPPKAHSLPLKTSAQPAPPPTVSPQNRTGGADGPALTVVEAPPPPPAPAPLPPMPVTPDLATLQAVKEQLRQEHPDWYPAETASAIS
jgi:hypothetical protein